MDTSTSGGREIEPHSTDHLSRRGFFTFEWLRGDPKETVQENQSVAVRLGEVYGAMATVPLYIHTTVSEMTDPIVSELVATRGTVDDLTRSINRQFDPLNEVADQFHQIASHLGVAHSKPEDSTVVFTARDGQSTQETNIAQSVAINTRGLDTVSIGMSPDVFVKDSGVLTDEFPDLDTLKKYVNARVFMTLAAVPTGVVFGAYVGWLGVNLRRIPTLTNGLPDMGQAMRLFIYDIKVGGVSRRSFLGISAGIALLTPILVSCAQFAPVPGADVIPPKDIPATPTVTFTPNTKFSDAGIARAMVTNTLEAQYPTVAITIAALKKQIIPVYETQFKTKNSSVRADIVPISEQAMSDVASTPFIVNAPSGEWVVPVFQNGTLQRFAAIPKGGIWERDGVTGSVTIDRAAIIIPNANNEKAPLVFDQTIGMFVDGASLTKGGANEYSGIMQYRKELSAFAAQQYTKLDGTLEQSSEPNTALQLIPYYDNQNVLRFAVKVAKGKDTSLWVSNSNFEFVKAKLPEGENIEIEITKDGIIKVVKVGEVSSTTNFRFVDPNTGEVLAFTIATATPKPTIAPSATSTSEPLKTPTAAPTLTRAPTVAPTEVLRPALETNFYTYGGVKNFAPPEVGGIPWTSENPLRSLWMEKTNRNIGILPITYEIFYEGERGYKIKRGTLPFEGKSVGKVALTSGYFFEVKDASWVDKVQEKFMIKSDEMNSSGITVKLEITLADNPVYDHIAPGGNYLGGTFYQVVDEKGIPAKANPGLVRSRKDATHTDVVGIGGKDATVANYIKSRIDAVTKPNQTVQIEGITNKDGVWLILITE